jgi:hypothetical protein
MTLLRDRFTDEEERDKERQETPIDHTRIRVCSSEHYVFLQEISFSSQGTEGTEILFRKRDYSPAGRLTPICHVWSQT